MTHGGDGLAGERVRSGLLVRLPVETNTAVLPERKLIEVDPLYHKSSFFSATESLLSALSVSCGELNDAVPVKRVSIDMLHLYIQSASGLPERI